MVMGMVDMEVDKMADKVADMPCHGEVKIVKAVEIVKEIKIVKEVKRGSWRFGCADVSLLKQLN